MPMEQNGLAKLLEELGEVSQVAGKMIGYPDLQLARKAKHPDGTNLRTRLEYEIGDLMAAVAFVGKKLDLDQGAILARADAKLNLFQQWDRE